MVGKYHTNTRHEKTPIKPVSVVKMKLVFVDDSLTEFKVKNKLFRGATCWLKCPCYQWVVQSEFFLDKVYPPQNISFLHFP